MDGTELQLIVSLLTVMIVHSQKPQWWCRETGRNLERLVLWLIAWPVIVCSWVMGMSDLNRCPGYEAGLLLCLTFVTWSVARGLDGHTNISYCFCDNLMSWFTHPTTNGFASCLGGQHTLWDFNNPPMIKTKVRRENSTKQRHVVLVRVQGCIIKLTNTHSFMSKLFVCNMNLKIFKSARQARLFSHVHVGLINFKKSWSGCCASLYGGSYDCKILFSFASWVDCCQSFCRPLIAISSVHLLSLVMIRFTHV